MVHALEEIWRVLKPNSILIDLRPVVTGPQFELLTDAGPESAGKINDAGHLVEDRAGDAALQDLIERGLFMRDTETDFKFAFYWDSVGSMEEYVDEKWTTSQIPKEVMAKAKRLEGEAFGDVRVRVRRKLQLGTYIRLEA